jgi:hypothetical protein
MPIVTKKVVLKAEFRSQRLCFRIIGARLAPRRAQAGVGAVAVEAPQKFEQWPRGHGSARVRADKEGAVLQERVQYRAYGVSTRAVSLLLRITLPAPQERSSRWRLVAFLSNKTHPFQFYNTKFSTTVFSSTTSSCRR